MHEDTGKGAIETAHPINCGRNFNLAQLPLLTCYDMMNKPTIQSRVRKTDKSETIPQSDRTEDFDEYRKCHQHPFIRPHKALTRHHTSNETNQFSLPKTKRDPIPQKASTRKHAKLSPTKPGYPQVTLRAHTQPHSLPRQPQPAHDDARPSTHRHYRLITPASHVPAKRRSSFPQGRNDPHPARSTHPDGR